MEISRNPNIETFERELKRKNISGFAVGLIPNIGDENSVGFAHYDEFIAFLKNENIKSIFYRSVSIEIDDYYITDDVIEELLGNYKAENLSQTIEKAIVEYNLSIEHYEEQLHNLRHNIYFTVYNGFMVYIILADYVNIADPREQLEFILASKEAEITAERAQQDLLFEEQKAKLKQKILDDPAFYQCTNQKLRRAYIDGLIPHLSNEYSLIKKKWTGFNTGFTFMDARNFVDLLWKEYKENTK